MLDFLLNPNGRVSRRAMWVSFLFPYIGLSVLAGLLDQAMFASQLASLDKPFAFSGDIASIFASRPPSPFANILALAYFWPSIAVSVKRFHDRGMSGWWVLIFLLGAVGAAIGMGVAGLAWLADFDRAAMPTGVLAMALVLIAVLLTQFVILYLLPGQEGANRYGPDPLSRAITFDDAAGAGELDGRWAQIEARMTERARADQFDLANPRDARPEPISRRRAHAGGPAQPAFGRRTR